MNWPDGKCRCSWANAKNPLYIHYHDEEWGKPLHDDRALFELLALEGFQAGLSWECVLNKRENFRAAFEGFNLDKILGWNEENTERLLRNPGIIRNRLKIAAVLHNARVFRSIQEECGSFDSYLWAWTEGGTIYEKCRTSSPLSDAISKDLRGRGMKFAGSVIVYSYLQTAGLIYGHETGCFLEKSETL